MTWSTYQLQIRLGEVREEARTAAAKGLKLGAEHVLQVSRTRVPIEEATLERSGATSIDPAQLVAAVSYDTPYAVVQHEDLTMQHDTGRQAKYLESALTGESDVVSQIVANTIRDDLGT